MLCYVADCGEARRQWYKSVRGCVRSGKNDTLDGEHRFQFKWLQIEFILVNVQLAEVNKQS